jgi:iron(III) transport system substrate-binding protein
MTVDVGGLSTSRTRASPRRSSPTSSAAVPETLRDPNGHWFALSKRARVLYVDKDLD